MNIPRGGHEKLRVYTVSYELWLELATWSKGIRWGQSSYLSLQLLRAAHSTPSNIAEGQARSTNKDFVHFLKIAQGSAREVQHNLKGLQDLGILLGERAVFLSKQAIAVDCMLTKLIRYRESLPSKGITEKKHRPS